MEIHIDHVSEYLHYYNPQDLAKLGKQLIDILNKYEDRLLISNSNPKLMNRGLEFFKLILSLTEHYNLNYRKSYLNNAGYKSIIQLQELKSALKRLEYIDRETGENKVRQFKIAFKLPGNTITVDDEALSMWIRKQLLKAYNEFDITMEDFGDAMFLLDSENNLAYNEKSSEELRKYAERPMSFSKIVYLFCNGIIEYMKAAFDLLPHNAKYLSEQQLSFLYELLCLMDFEGFQKEFSTDEYPSSLDIDRLYQMLNK
ncbi:hypothetical protein KHS38_15325 [Mucilaginibacter sp. Bleaf8]|uniref:hypothetical protein n=1 Tax=Mucilaginibacter sp. Bleaf8 TaxID=2834430 RepID=UPI001BCBDF7F|nr:hypothetical protein [Mucilaginibacter sp. Bleaf8]MBS7565779.1 hypothetical protein [Mucilaginibacter sp. Bleaf8]